MLHIHQDILHTTDTERNTILYTDKKTQYILHRQHNRQQDPQRVCLVEGHHEDTRTFCSVFKNFSRWDDTAKKQFSLKLQFLWPARM